MDIQPYNPQFLKWMRTYNAMRGLDLSCRYADDWTGDDLPDVCPNCGERCELDGEPICGECERDSSRGKKSEEESEETCDCCGGSGTIYVMRHDSWCGMREIPVVCECRFPVLLPYNVRMLAIEELSGLNEV